jgi:hypothetical protein
MGLVAAGLERRYALPEPDRWADLLRDPAVRRWLRRPNTAPASV